MTEHRRWYLHWTDPVTGIRHGHIRWPNGKPPPPYGCRWCGRPADNHGLLHVGSVGQHHWASPTVRQQRARMLARRCHLKNSKLAERKLNRIEQDQP